jgi:transcriptional regulator with GAF, ATPase, and Fis domain
MQRRHILAALKQTEGRVTGPEGAARLLQLNDRTLASKMRKLGIKRDDYLRKKS